MLWPWWALEVFSLGLSEIHALSESIPYISHSKMLPLDQPTRASQTTWLECVSDIQEERNQKGLIQFPCTIFFQKYIFTWARNQGTRFGLWIERSVFVIHLMPFAGKYYTLHLIQPQETLPVHSFIPFCSRELTKWLWGARLWRGLPQTPRLLRRPVHTAPENSLQFHHPKLPYIRSQNELPLHPFLFLIPYKYLLKTWIQVLFSQNYLTSVHCLTSFKDIIRLWFQIFSRAGTRLWYTASSRLP